ncbi:unnamed protein product [Musa textilis]
MLQLEPFTEDWGQPAVQPLERVPAHQLPCAFRVSAPVDSHACQTPWSVFQDGLDGEPTGRCPGRASTPWGTPMARIVSSTASTVSPPMNDPSGFGRRRSPHRSAPRAERRTGRPLFRIRPSPFHLSLAVLVRYRSLAHILPWMKFTARLGLHSQTTRLVDSALWCDRVRVGRGSHPPRCPFPWDLGPVHR